MQTLHPEQPGAEAEDEPGSEGGRPRNSHKFVQDSWALELFAGTVGITAALVSKGLSGSFGIDNKSHPERKGRSDQGKSPEFGVALIRTRPVSDVVSAALPEIYGPDLPLPLRDAGVQKKYLPSLGARSRPRD